MTYTEAIAIVGIEKAATVTTYDKAQYYINLAYWANDTRLTQAWTTIQRCIVFGR